MCGIVAYWDPTTDAATRRAIANVMSRRIAHRGPDGAGIWEPAADSSPPPLIFAHRRLAIRGLGAQGAQPMIGERGVLSFNGELFGLESLRHEIATAGVPLHGSSDTEVLLRALDLWGISGALTRIHGQFAFAWWSLEERHLYLARDRVGIRPVYYAQRAQRFALASEQKALLALPWVDATPSSNAMLRYLLLSRTDDIGGETMLCGIRSLPAGHYAVWDGQELHTERYHRFSTDVPRTTVADVRRELERAVAEQLVSDVPIGATVSGGLDSSSVALLADRERIARNDRTTLHLFAYHDTAAEADEREYQRAVIAAIRSPHQIHWVSSSSDELERNFDAYVQAQEEPYGDVSSYAEMCLATEAKRHGVKVLLGGLGGDEVFVGYGSYFGPLLLDVALRGDLRALRQILRVSPQVLGTSGAHGAPLVAAGYHMLPARLRNAATALRSARGASLSRGLAWQGARDAWSTWHTHDGRGHTNSALRGSIESWSIPRYLLHSDRMGLACGVETRVPLLDDQVIKTAFGIPPADRVGASGIKTALREALRDVLPPAVRDRAWKLGFHAPLGVYVRGLDARLREGHATAGSQLGFTPKWEEMSLAAKWRWGNLGAYLSWTRSQPVSPVSAAELSGL